MTLTDTARPSPKHQISTQLRDLALVLGGSLFIALSSQVAVPLPFSPVPVTGQTLAILLIGIILGARRGALSVLLYLIEGVMGLPVFAGGAFGVARLVGPTGGYLWGFVLAAFVVGLLAERGWGRRMYSALVAMLIVNAIISLVGLPWLARFVGIDRVLPLGLYPFIVGDLLKVALATVTFAAGQKMLPLKLKGL